MNVNDHPELEVLTSYLNNSASAEFSHLRLHLAQCPECRTLVDGLTGLQAIAMQASHLKLSEEQYQLIDDYIHHRLNSDEQKKASEFINSKPAAMKAALHTASRKSSQERTDLLDKPQTSTIISENSHIEPFFSWLKSLFTYKTPAWLSVPVALAFITLVSFNLFEQSTDQPNYTIARYQDNAIVQFRSRDSLPGIGFFSNSESSSTNYDGLQVSVSDNGSFQLHWPAIDNAIKYNLRLQMFELGKKVDVANINTENNSALINTHLDNIYHRYEWVLTGETGDHRVFMATGGFVINQLNKGTLE